MKTGFYFQISINFRKSKINKKKLLTENMLAYAMTSKSKLNKYDIKKKSCI